MIWIFIVAIILVVAMLFVFFVYYRNPQISLDDYQTRKVEKLKRIKYLVDSNATYVRLYVTECSAKQEGQTTTRKYLTAIHKQGIGLLLSDIKTGNDVSRMTDTKLELLKDVIDGNMTEADALKVDKSLNEGISLMITSQKTYNKEISSVMSDMSTCALAQAKFIREKNYIKSMEAFEEYKAHSRKLFTVLAKMILNSKEDDDLKV